MYWMLCKLFFQKNSRHAAYSQAKTKRQPLQGLALLFNYPAQTGLLLLHFNGLRSAVGQHQTHQVHTHRLAIE